jgi:hypothetical protein
MMKKKKKKKNVDRRKDTVERSEIGVGAVCHIETSSCSVDFLIPK